MLLPDSPSTLSPILRRGFHARQCISAQSFWTALSRVALRLVLGRGAASTTGGSRPSAGSPVRPTGGRSLRGPLRCRRAGKRSSRSGSLVFQQRVSLKSHQNIFTLPAKAPGAQTRSFGCIRFVAIASSLASYMPASREDAPLASRDENTGWGVCTLHSTSRGIMPHSFGNAHQGPIPFGHQRAEQPPDVWHAYCMSLVAQHGSRNA